MDCFIGGDVTNREAFNRIWNNPKQGMKMASCSFGTREWTGGVGRFHSLSDPCPLSMLARTGAERERLGQTAAHVSWNAE